MSDIFLSYAREDLPRVKPVVDALTARGWSVWWDRTIKPGQIFERVIEAALNEAKCVVVLWSRNSIRSEWVSDEAREGRQQEKLIPALLDEVSMPLGFRSRHAANLIGWQGALPHDGFEELASAVEGILATPAAPFADAAAAGDVPRVFTTALKLSLVAGETRVNPIDGQTYVWIPPGKFTMGCSQHDSECFDDEKPSHELTITRGFWLGQTMVTEAAYARFAQANGRKPAMAPTDLPMVNASWDDAQSHCQWAGMRLPTEAEWEYAARAGTTGSRYGDLDDVAWYSGNSGGMCHPVGRKQPNAWGLYDMLGDAWEWVADWYNDYTKLPIGSPSAFRVLRGGCYVNDPRWVRVSSRGRNVPAGDIGKFGFRCAGELR